MSQISSPNQIVSDIDAYIRQFNEPYARWYVGIASNPRNRLFIDHNVSEQGGRWIHGDAGSEAEARAIEKKFIDAGCQGGTSGGDGGTRSVYAYYITNSTRE